ncbi:unnamed protein product [Cuscuta epithymum]|uniref:Uncharacterized protein n=1 Tax=Cuscuta epithymum TaxID=186058 RepID=A0AAV0BYJ9_9ASTE|nr:unnamed protein product [Cuscuta epithymum]
MFLSKYPDLGGLEWEEVEDFGSLPLSFPSLLFPSTKHTQILHFPPLPSPPLRNPPTKQGLNFRVPNRMMIQKVSILFTVATGGWQVNFNCHFGMVGQRTGSFGCQPAT